MIVALGIRPKAAHLLIVSDVAGLSPDGAGKPDGTISAVTHKVRLTLAEERLEYLSRVG